MRKLLLTICVLFMAFDLMAQNIVLLGEDNSAVSSALKSAGYQVTFSADGQISDADMVILNSSHTVSPTLRQSIGNYLQNKGNVAIIGGPYTFDYKPVPYDSQVVVDFNDQNSYIVERDRRNPKAGSLETPKPVIIRSPKGTPAVELKTEVRCMPDMFIKIDMSKHLDDSRQVLTFSACGNEYMDLLALEIVDRKGDKWLSFVSVGKEWADYAVSLADFIPQGSKEEYYEPLKPSQVSRLFIGANLMTIWQERPTYLAVSDVAFARNHNHHYAPTSELIRMKLPFEMMGTKVPNVIFDPAYKAYEREGHMIIRNSLDWVTGVTMGADNRQGYKFKAEREGRIIPLREIKGVGNAAQIELFAGGPYQGAALALFLSNGYDNQLPSEIVTAANLMTRTASVVSADMNVTPIDDQGRVYPELTVVVRNPLNKIVSGKLSVDINGVNEGGTDVVLKRRSCESKQLQLLAVGVGFPTPRFDWNIKLSTDKTENVFADSVNLERAMLIAFRHLINNQNNYPDNRISNHYFGDAYGVRAMLAFLHHADREAVVRRNRDIFKTMSFDDMLNCAYNFFDMLVERQSEEGKMMMGYSEHTAGCNVADMGQLTLAIMQSAQYVPDKVRRERYMAASRRLVGWFENFYIDAEREKELRKKFPNNTKFAITEGEYGLGEYGLGEKMKRRYEGYRWILADILGAQSFLAFYDTKESAKMFRPIYDRNAHYYINSNYSSESYFQAEAMFWLRKTINNNELISKIDDNLRNTMLAKRYKGTKNEMYKSGSRGTLNALPLLYYQRYIGDDANIRAVLLKYYWAFASTGSFRNMERQSPAFPKSFHGEGISASKFASFSSLWAVEALYPESTITPQ